MAAARSRPVYGWLLAAGYGATFVFGLWAIDDESINILSLNGADNALHLAFTVVGLAIALWPSRARRVTGDTATAVNMERSGTRVDQVP